MRISIKNMVCQGTRSYVIQEMEKLGIPYTKFENDEIHLEKDLTLPQIQQVDHAFRQYGLESVFHKSSLVSRILNAVHDAIERKITLSTGLANYISDYIGYNYYYLNSYFFRETGLSIEEYYIARQEDVIRNKMRKNSLMRSYT